ncbi:MAG: hypothetical protein AWU54_1720 [Candidatus Frackibacter sp. T328-2]|nr:MAG: hypothetical protein AWU54_1720 [Candidatus Frackibacter sp. T328-2]
MYFKLQLGKDGNDVVYPIPIDAIRAPKYRKDTLECVCQLDYNASNGSSVIRITEQEYLDYPQCQLITDKTEIQADGTDTATLTVDLPVIMQGEQITLYNKETEKTLDFADSDSKGQATFTLTSTQSGKVFRLVAESDKFTMSEEVLIKVS